MAQVAAEARKSCDRSQKVKVAPNDKQLRCNSAANKPTNCPSCNIPRELRWNLADAKAWRRRSRVVSSANRKPHMFCCCLSCKCILCGKAREMLHWHQDSFQGHYWMNHDQTTEPLMLLCLMPSAQCSRPVLQVLPSPHLLWLLRCPGSPFQLRQPNFNKRGGFSKPFGAEVLLLSPRVSTLHT